MTTHIALRPTGFDTEALWDLEEAITIQLARRRHPARAVMPEVLCPPKRGKAQALAGIQETDSDTFDRRSAS